jgi:hypothetical protein
LAFNVTRGQVGAGRHLAGCRASLSEKGERYGAPGCSAPPTDRRKLITTATISPSHAPNTRRMGTSPTSISCRWRRIIGRLRRRQESARPRGPKGEAHPESETSPGFGRRGRTASTLRALDGATSSVSRVTARTPAVLQPHQSSSPPLLQFSVSSAPTCAIIGCDLC